jgi:hypothetical protein
VEASGPELETEEMRRRDVLQRLQGRDTQLESGLKVRYAGQSAVQGMCNAVCRLHTAVALGYVAHAQYREVGKEGY